MTKISNSDIQTRAKELVEKHGKSAVEIVKRKADAFKNDCREKDHALMILTEVEKLTDLIERYNLMSNFTNNKKNNF